MQSGDIGGSPFVCHNWYTFFRDHCREHGTKGHSSRSGSEIQSCNKNSRFCIVTPRLQALYGLRPYIFDPMSLIYTVDSKQAKDTKIFSTCLMPWKISPQGIQPENKFKEMKASQEFLSEEEFIADIITEI